MRQKYLRGSRAWSVLAACVLVYEIASPEGELLSEAVDRALLKSPLLTHMAVTITALHLLNYLPPRCDPFAYLPRLVAK